MFEYPFVYGGTVQTHILMSSHYTYSSCYQCYYTLFVINPFYRELYQEFFVNSTPYLYANNNQITNIPAWLPISQHVIIFLLLAANKKMSAQSLADALRHTAFVVHVVSSNGSHPFHRIPAICRHPSCMISYYNIFKTFPYFADVLQFTLTSQFVVKCTYRFYEFLTIFPIHVTKVLIKT